PHPAAAGNCSGRLSFRSLRPGAGRSRAFEGGDPPTGGELRRAAARRAPAEFSGANPWHGLAGPAHGAFPPGSALGGRYVGILRGALRGTAQNGPGSESRENLGGRGSESPGISSRGRGRRPVDRAAAGSFGRDG